MKNGDVYRWYYKNDEEYRKQHSGSGTAYWCMDNQCVVVDGKLYDTYWCYNLETFSSNCKVLDVDRMDLEFVCNLNDIKFIHKSEADEYDIVYNLSYMKSCHERYAVRKEATKSNEAIKRKILKKILDNKDEIAYLQREIERQEKQLEELQ